MRDNKNSCTWVVRVFSCISNLIGKVAIRRLTRMFSIYLPTIKTLKTGVNSVEKLTLYAITTTTNL